MWKILTPHTFARHTLRDITSHLQIVVFDWEIVLKRKLMSGHLRLPRVVNRVDQSGIIVGWPSHSQKVWYCVSKGIWFQPKGGGRHRQTPSAAFKCFRQSGIIGVRTCRLIFFGWLASIHHSIGTLTRCIDTWLCNGFASMVSAWLGICNVSCYTYMNVSNGWHSAKTTRQLPVTNGFTMIADDGMTLSSRL